jgi:hypothetical protein
VVTRASVPATALLLAVSAGAALGLAGPDAPYRPIASGPSLSGGRFWSHEAANTSRPMAAAVTQMAGEVPIEPGVVNVVLGKDRVLSYFESSYLSIYQRAQRSVDSTLLLAVLEQGPTELGAAAIARNQRVRIIALDEAGVRFAQLIEVRYPGLVADIRIWPAPSA